MFIAEQFGVGWWGRLGLELGLDGGAGWGWMVGQDGVGGRGRMVLEGGECWGWREGQVGVGGRGRLWVEREFHPSE